MTNFSVEITTCHLSCLNKLLVCNPLTGKVNKRVIFVLHSMSIVFQFKVDFLLY